MERERIAGKKRRAGSRAGVFPLFLLLLQIPSTAFSAQVPEPRDPSLYRGWPVSGFEIRGIEGDLKDDLAAGLALAGKRKFLRTEYSLFSEEVLRKDIERVRLLLARNGYPSSSITPLFDSDTGEREVEVVFRIDLGPAVRLLENRTEALPPELEKRAAEVLDIEDGEIFTDRRVERRVDDLLLLLRESGRAEARIRTEILRPDSASARVLFHVRAGPVFRFGRTVVRGAGEDLTEVVRRSIDIDRGSLYSPEKLRRADESLRMLDLFRKVRISTEKTEGETLDVVAELAERAPRTIDAGVGYWTVDEFRVTADWKHRNLLGKGRGIGLGGSYSRYMQTAAIRAWKPVLFHSRTNGSITLRGSRESEETYRLLSTELEIAASYFYSSRASLRPAVTIALFELEAKTDTAGAYPDPGPNLINLSLDWSFSRLDDRLYPTRGTYARVFLETGFPGFETGENYALFEPEAIAYAPLPFGLVFASRWRIGYAAPQRSSNGLLPNKRFYAGGTGSMRGYQRRMLGPLDSGDKPIGGIAKSELSVELRFPIFWRLEGAIFCDTGQVWRGRGAIRPFHQEVAAGPGLQVRTPIGPIRVDVGFPVTPVPDSEPETVFHLSVGQVY